MTSNEVIPGSLAATVPSELRDGRVLDIDMSTIRCKASLLKHSVVPVPKSL